MPREAQLFDSCSGSAVKGFLKLQGNIPPRWIDNARTSRKTIEPTSRNICASSRGLGRNIPERRAPSRALPKICGIF